MKKKKYDTSVVMLYLLKQEHSLPKEFRQKIPYSTISSWRKSAYENYEGSQFRFLFDENWDVIRLKHENQKLKSTLRAISQSYLLLKTELEKFIKVEKKNKDFQNKLVLAVSQLRKHLSLELTLKLLFTHRNQFYEWAVASRHNCSHSFNALCLRRYPRQLQRKEVDKLKSMLSSPKYENWPIVSIAAQGLRNKEIVASLYSWYKYARILNLPHESCKKTTKQVGLIALKPNEYLHVDTTYYPISGTGKACITIVMDNYSKMILGFAVEERLSITLIQFAIKSALTPILQQQGGVHSYLVSDGGWENTSPAMNQFITGLKEYRLSKITALKDIQFSNSPVEAIHKILKGRYLRNKVFETVQGLANFLKDAIHDYNYKRPHYKHFPKTPAEVYFNIDLKINFNKRKLKAVEKRVKNNATTACNICRMQLLKKSAFPQLHSFFL